MDCRNDRQHTIITCNHRLNLDSIRAQKDALTQALIAKLPILFYANNVVQADTASLQLLSTFALSASQKNITWEWKDPSFSLIHAAELLGVKELLRLPEK